MDGKTIDEMTPEELRIAVAESQGWSWVEESHNTWWNASWKLDKESLVPRGEDMTTRRRNRSCILPDYCTDRNALAPVLAKLTEQQWDNFTVCLLDLEYNSTPETEIVVKRVATATPEQMCRAYLKAIL